MSYRDDVAALAARKAALDQQLRELTRERDETAKLLALPVLPNMRVAAPCNASWDAMTGDDRARHCGECKQQVFNLSALTTEQAESLIREKNGDLCVRYYKRQDGTVLTANCSVGTKRRERRRTVAASAVAMSLFGGGIASAVVSQPPEPLEPDTYVTMGKYESAPSSCETYMESLQLLAPCLPADGRQSMLDAAENMRKSISQLPGEARLEVEKACQQALPTIQQSIQAACKPSEERDERRRDDGERE